MSFTNNSGALISATDAAAMLQSYMAKHNISVNNPPDPNVIYGHAFGLNKMKELIAVIDSYNADPSTEKEIIGVRVYKCLNTYEGDDIEDVFLIPITAADKDLFPVRTDKTIPQTHGNMILDQSLPCPTICGK